MEEPDGIRNLIRVVSQLFHVILVPGLGTRDPGLGTRY